MEKKLHLKVTHSPPKEPTLKKKSCQVEIVNSHKEIKLAARTLFHICVLEGCAIQ